jgi:Tol biopolymer transport system component/DNA-binding winged helix-turn-helix (wHTH) protein
MTRNGSDRVRFGPFEVDLHTHELWKFGTRLKLVGQPFEILVVLLNKPGELVTREELRTRLWPGDTFVDFNHGLNAAVNKLRESLSDSAEKPRYVETLPRRGYRFIANIECAAKAVVPDPRSPDLPTPPTIESPSAPRTNFTFSDAGPATDAPRPGAVLHYLVGAGVLFTFFLAAAFLFRTSSSYGAGSPTRSIVEHTRPLLAISDTDTPAFSPDGNSVAFHREHSQPGESGIYVTAVGSEQLMQLTSNDDDRYPVWSPDGRWIAFTRASHQTHSIHLVAADGGGDQKRNAEQSVGPISAALKLTSSGTAERELPTGGVTVSHGELDWSPDGKCIAFAGQSGIYLLSLEDSTVRRITEPPPMVEDWGPSFSPDGQRIMFVRNREIGAPDEIRATPISGGEGMHLFSERGRISSAPQWSFDGRSVIFSSNRNGHPTLYRVSLDAPDSAMEISEAGSPAWNPTVSRHGYRMVYERLLRSVSIWQMNLNDSRDKRPYLTVSSTSDTDQGPGAQFSPDGKHLAYMSDRSGTMEIWISNSNGSNGFQLSAVGGAGTPRWSPDSFSVAFDVATTSGSKIVTMNLHGGAPLTLTPDAFHSVCPSWSHDGKWVYFGSPRSGDWQVWKVPATGGAPVQVTQYGGHAALASPDGKYVYYAKTPQAEPEIWRVPVNGGAEVSLPLVHPGTWASWQIVKDGILFVGPSLGHQAVLSFYDFARQRTTTIAVLNRVPFWLGATPDGRTVAFDQPGQEQAQTMLVENFR